MQYGNGYVIEVFLSYVCQESLKKFREEAEKLEKSESLQKAREKYVRLLLMLLCIYCISTKFVIVCIFVFVCHCLFIWFLCKISGRWVHVSYIADIHGCAGFLYSSQLKLIISH